MTQHSESNNEPMDALKTYKKDIAYFMRRLYKRGLTTTSGGNISMLQDNFLLITPSQTDKGRMKAKEVCVVDTQGLNRTPKQKLSMETAMHQAVYAVRSDVRAIVHAHPPFATSFAVSHQTITTALMGESWSVLGLPAFAPYEIMGSEALAQNVAQAALHANVVVMANHGILAMGNSLLEAFDRIEVLENCAKIQLLASLNGTANELQSEQIEAINKLIQ